MDITNKSQTIRSEVLRSPSLYFKEFEATEKINNKKHRLLSGTRIKAVLMPLMYWVPTIPGPPLPVDDDLHWFLGIFPEPNQPEEFR